MMTILTRSSDRQTVSLGKQIASSGEGEVWETNFSGILAKIYHDSTPERIDKLKVMLANPPVDPMKSKNHISIAFPQDLLLDAGGNCVGFLMPAVRSSRELPSIYHPRLRKRNAPGFNWYYLHVTALNTAWIIQAIHEKGYVLGDIKPQNILVNDRALVAVIDTDSFQVRDSKTRKVYRCTVGSDGFTPVELLGKDFSTTDQTEICDRFRLAVLIHYLLFGYHPFSGEWTGAGESPDQTELIRKGLWYGGNNSLIRPSQITIPLDVVHPEIKRLFLKCFNDGHASPKLRPSAEDWHNGLQVAVNNLTSCGTVDSHHYSRNYGKCYWCERSARLGVDIFPGVHVTPKASPPTSTLQVFEATKTLKLVQQNGNEITVSGQVISTRYHNTNQVFLNFGHPSKLIDGYRSFRIVVPSNSLTNLYHIQGLTVDNLKSWKTQFIQISGTLVIHQIKWGVYVPQIVLNDYNQIKVIANSTSSRKAKSITKSKKRQTKSTTKRPSPKQSSKQQPIPQPIPYTPLSPINFWDVIGAIGKIIFW
jgi:serine/threonine protein kinase